MFVAELGMGDAIVRRNTEDHAIVPRKLLLMVGEFDRLPRAAGRAVSGIKIQDDVFLALERSKIDRLHVGVGEGKNRSGLSDLQHIGFHVPDDSKPSGEIVKPPAEACCTRATKRWI